jgi:WD40 repeat protein
VKVWDLESFALKTTLPGHTGNVKALCVMGNRLFSGSSDLSIKVSCFFTLRIPSYSYQLPQGLEFR